MIVFVMMVYWFVCIWYVIGLFEVLEKLIVSWFYVFGEVINKLYVNFIMEIGFDEGFVYVIVLYFMLISMIMVGFGNVVVNINGEKVFVVVIMLIGGKLLCVLLYLLFVIKELKRNF